MIGVFFLKQKNVKILDWYRETKRAKKKKKKKNNMSQIIIFRTSMCPVAFFFFYPLYFLSFTAESVSYTRKKTAYLHILVVVTDRLLSNSSISKCTEAHR